MAERSPRDPRDPRDPLDEAAAWAEIVAGYGEQPSFPDEGDGKGEGTGDPTTPGTEPGTEPGTGTGPDAGAGTGTGAGTGSSTGAGAGSGGASAPGSFIVFAPGVGPRDWSPSGPSGDGSDEAGETDDDHFTPPEPPPLPKADVTAKFAWIAVLGGPLLLVAMVLLQQPVTWWITVLGIGGFLGGFATLVARMKGDDEDDDHLPGGGAVV